MDSPACLINVIIAFTHECLKRVSTTILSCDRYCTDQTCVCARYTSIRFKHHGVSLFEWVINPRRACARVTVLVLSVCLSVCVCVCVCVCFPYSGTSRNQAYKQQYQRLQRDTGMKYKKGFFFKTLPSEVMASFTHLE